MSDVQEIEAYLAHYGVKGMRWGVRRGGDDSSGGTARKSKPATKKGQPPRRSKAEMERLAEVRKARIKLGKDITKNVLIAIGTVAVSSMAGPVVASGAAAVARSLPGEAFSAGTTWKYDSGTNITTRIKDGESVSVRGNLMPRN